LRALYWAIQTLDTIGFGDIVAHSEVETWYCVGFFYTAALMIYLSVSNLVIFMNNMDSERNKYKLMLAKFDTVQSWRENRTAVQVAGAPLC
jgi:hypothetical protein